MFSVLGNMSINIVSLSWCDFLGFFLLSTNILIEKNVFLLNAIWITFFQCMLFLGFKN